MTKVEAIKLAKELRAKGKTVRVMRTSGVYTVPGKGVVAYIDYFVEVAP